MRAGPGGKPPFNMHNALIFHGAIICALSLPVLALKGRQTRRERDEMETGHPELDPTGVVPPAILLQNAKGVAQSSLDAFN